MEDATMEQNRFGPPDSNNQPRREAATTPGGGTMPGGMESNPLGGSTSGLSPTSGPIGGMGSNLGSSNLGSTNLGSTNLGSSPQGTVQKVTGTVAGKVKERVAGMVDERKAQATGSLQQIAGALREVGETLERNDLAPASALSQRAADQIERTAGYLQRRDFEGLVRDTRQFARNHPEVVVGTAVLAGLLIGRFLRSSSPEPELLGSSLESELEYPSELSGGVYSEPSGSYPRGGGWA
jgi:hypothetical protein